MKRLVPVVAALTLVAAACGGGDDPVSEAPPADTVEETTDESTDATDDEATSTEEPAADEPETSDDADDPTTGETADADTDDGDDAGDDDGDDDGDDAGGVTVRSIDDIPEVCRDEMAEFLRAVEPIVSTIDWQTATMADFEQIATEFEAQAEEFELATSDAGCNELTFADESEGSILIEFAEKEAPGAVGFLEFLEQMRTGATPDDEGSAAPDGIETCQDAIDFLQGLMDDYESMSGVPAAELVKIPNIAPLYAECTPEQLEFFDNPELEQFMGE
jgi:hypothetical protein